MRVIRTCFSQPILQGRQRRQSVIIVYILQQKHIWRDFSDNLTHGDQLGVVTFSNVAQQKTGAIPSEFDIVSGDPQRISCSRQGCKDSQTECKKAQACCKVSASA